MNAVNCVRKQYQFNISRKSHCIFTACGLQKIKWCSENNMGDHKSHSFYKFNDIACWYRCGTGNLVYFELTKHQACIIEG